MRLVIEDDREDEVEKLELRISRLAAMTEGRQQDTDGVFAAFKERQDLIDTRMRQRDEAVEAMGESIDQLSRCKCGVGGELMQRVKVLEKAKEDDIFPARGRLTLVCEEVERLKSGANAAGQDLLRRVQELETQNRDALEAHRTRGLQLSLIHISEPTRPY